MDFWNVQNNCIVDLHIGQAPPSSLWSIISCFHYFTKKIFTTNLIPCFITYRVLLFIIVCQIIVQSLRFGGVPFVAGGEMLLYIFCNYIWSLQYILLFLHWLALFIVFKPKLNLKKTAFELNTLKIQSALFGNDVSIIRSDDKMWEFN